MICGNRPKRGKRQRFSFFRDVDRLPRLLHYIQDLKQILLVLAKQKIIVIESLKAYKSPGASTLKVTASSDVRH